MAETRTETVGGGSEPGFEGGSEPEEELESLEMEVKEMAQKILHYRATLPDQLKDTLASVLASQRPVLPHGSDPVASSDPNPGLTVSSNGALLAEGDQETQKKIQLLKAKIADNVSAMPSVLKRMKECISKINQLDLHNNRIIHPAFKGKMSG